MPGVRKTFLHTINQRYKTIHNKPWIRQVSSSLIQTDAPLKIATLKFLNLGFKKQCLKYKFNFNKNFAGVYSLTPTAHYKNLLHIWLRNSPKNTLIMCHPAKNITDTDTIATTRLKEYEVLRSL